MRITQKEEVRQTPKQMENNSKDEGDGQAMEEISRLAKDRVAWRTFVSALRSNGSKE